MAAHKQQVEVGEESPVEDPSMQSFLGKIKAFEKMDHFARAQRVLELQEAQNARVGLEQAYFKVLVGHGISGILLTFERCMLGMGSQGI